MTDAQFHAMTAELFPAPDRDAAPRTQNAHLDREYILTRLWADADTKPHPRTAWAGYQAIADTSTTTHPSAPRRQAAARAPGYSPPPEPARIKTAPGNSPPPPPDRAPAGRPTRPPREPSPGRGQPHVTPNQRSGSRSPLRPGGVRVRAHPELAPIRPVA